MKKLKEYCRRIKLTASWCWETLDCDEQARLRVAPLANFLMFLVMGLIYCSITGSGGIFNHICSISLAILLIQVAYYVLRFFIWVAVVVKDMALEVKEKWDMTK
tara:strand:+ start:292 stop:603 length:312 start_codon:yes stop_codon:yes gene_type:complete